MRGASRRDASRSIRGPQHRSIGAHKKPLQPRFRHRHRTLGNASGSRRSIFRTKHHVPKWHRGWYMSDLTDEILRAFLPRVSWCDRLHRHGHLCRQRRRGARIRLLPGPSGRHRCDDFSTRNAEHSRLERTRLSDLRSGCRAVHSQSRLQPHQSGLAGVHRRIAAHAARRAARSIRWTAQRQPSCAGVVGPRRNTFDPQPLMRCAGGGSHCCSRRRSWAGYSSRGTPFAQRWWAKRSRRSPTISSASSNDLCSMCARTNRRCTPRSRCLRIHGRWRCV